MVGSRQAALLVWLAVLPATARGEPWTTADTVVEAACIALLVVDWRQSLDRRYVESNPILGPHPSPAVVTGYFLGVMTVQVAVARLLPSPWRGVLQGVTLGIEGRSVVDNWRLGARMSW